MCFTNLLKLIYETKLGYNTFFKSMNKPTLPIQQLLPTALD